MLAALLGLTLAAAGTGPLTPPPLVEADSASEQPSSRHLGLTFDVGVPEGAGASLTFGPWRWLRLSAGPSWNGASVGVRGGVTLVPLSTFLRPTLSVHAGTFPEGDAQGTVRFFTGDEGFRQPLLAGIQYDFFSAHAGIEMGSPTGTSFFLRAGLSRTIARLHGFEDAAQTALGDSSITARTPVLTFQTPSLQLGLSITLL